jgi:hypothetical protein
MPKEDETSVKEYELVLEGFFCFFKNVYLIY